MNCKGDSIPERPHRMAKLQEAPDNLLAVSEAQLLDVAAWDDTDSGYLGNTAVTSDCGCPRKLDNLTWCKMPVN